MGAGRKPKPPGEKQGHSVNVKLTHDELRALLTAAEGEPLGTYVRRLVLRHLTRRKR